MSKISRRKFIIKSAEDALWLSALGMLPSFDLFGQASAPKRLVLFHIPDGLSRNFWPSAPGAIKLSPVLASFSGLESELSLVRGFRGTRDSHTGIPGLFTGADHSGEKETLDIKGASLDQYVADVIKGSSPHRSITLGAIRDNKRPGERALIISHNLQEIAPQLTPKHAIEAYFSNLLGLTPLNQASLTNTGDPQKHYQNILNLLESELSKISANARLGEFERKKMQLHAESLAKMLESSGKIPSTNANPECKKISSALNKDYAMDHGQYEGIIDAYSDIIVSGLTCGISNVFTLQLGRSSDSWQLPSIGQKYDAKINSLDIHGLAHHDTYGDSGALYDQSRQRAQDVCTWYVSKAAALAKKIAAIPEGTGSMLDNTLIVMASEFGPDEAQNHKVQDLGYLLIGGRNIGFATGKYFDLGAAKKANSVLLTTIAKAFGVTATVGREGGEVSELKRS